MQTELLTGRTEAPHLLKVQLGDETDVKMLLGAYCCTDIPGEFVWQPGVLTQVAILSVIISIQAIPYLCPITYFLNLCFFVQVLVTRCIALVQTHILSLSFIRFLFSFFNLRQFEMSNVCFIICKSSFCVLQKYLLLKSFLNLNISKTILFLIFPQRVALGIIVPNF